MERQAATQAATQADNARERAGSAGEAGPPTREPLGPVLQLRQAAGNRAFGAIVQAKLRISTPGDRFELEADRVAEEVMRMPDPSRVGPAVVAEESPVPQVQRACAGCAEAEETAGASAPARSDERQDELQLWAKRNGSGPRSPLRGAGLEGGLASMRGGDGQGLPPSVRAFFEPRFGVDFGGVRVHADVGAARTAEALGARAFTLGPDIVFGENQYRPVEETGQRLLAHELTHVVQQRAAPSRGVGGEPLGVTLAHTFEIQRDLALVPPGRLAEPTPLTPAEIADAVAFNNGRYGTREIRIIQDVVGASVTGTMDDETIHMIVELQADFRLTTDGKVGSQAVSVIIRELVHEGMFNHAITMIIEGFNLPRRNLASIRFDPTLTGVDADTGGVIGAGNPQTVRIGPSTFRENFAHMVRIIGHELQHVQQRSGAAPIRDQHTGDFLAFAWEACAGGGVPHLGAAARVNHADIALGQFAAMGAADRATHQAQADRLTDLVARGGTGAC